MDPSFKDYFDKLTNSLDAIHSDIRSHTTKLDDLGQWCPDLERRMDQLSAVGAELQAWPAAATEEWAAEAPTPPPITQPAPLHDHVGTSKRAEGEALGSIDHSIDVLPWGLAPMFASVATPANGQSQNPAQSTIASPYAHASQILAGIGQAHPSIGFPQFTGENPRLWKTLCEQYFQMFEIHEKFWVPMASLNFSGSASVWL